jgi:hypothetical protein
MIDNFAAIRIGRSYRLTLSDCLALGAFAQDEDDAHEIAAMWRGHRVDQLDRAA